MEHVWNLRPIAPVLADDEVHVWRARLDRPAEHFQELMTLLSEEECARADRFHFERHRRRFIAARGLLRVLLGDYLKGDARRVEFHYGAAGKPRLTPDIETPPLHFNVTHSGEIALFAFCRARELGIDVEQVRPYAHAEQIAKRFFSQRESALLQALPPEERNAAFFNAWTRKEALLKATGKGISFGLDRVEVALAPGQPAQFVSLDGDKRKAGGWALWSLTPAPGYVAAVALETTDHRLSCWGWPEGG
jgi:4'-phosphopantetheinyl transferase